MSAAVLNPIPGTLASLNLTAEPCGSRVTVSPEPQASDYDYLVVIPEDRGVVSDVVSGLDAAGFKWEGDEHYQDAAGNFMSWRRGDVNLIVTSNPSFAERHRVATGICKRLNLSDKADRIAVFQGVLYGNLEALAARDQTP